MASRITVAWRTCLGLLAIAAPSLAAEKPTLELLRLPTAKIEESNASPSETAGLRQLADGEPRSIATAAVEEGKSLEVVYLLGAEATCTPRKLTVRLPERMPPQASAAGIEVLASTVSPRAGFRLLGGGKLAAKAEPQEFQLQASAARWIMVRVFPEARGVRVALADLSITGTDGPPESEYLFAQSPAKALDVLKRLEQMKEVGVELASDEAALFADAEDGKLDRWSFGEAALVVSGVVDAKRRKPLVEQLERLAADAEGAVAAGKAPFKKGELLLRWLHGKGTLRKYVARQTDLPPILEAGDFNCVSSALLYNVLARRLGLDVKGIEVPDHAFSILYDGTRHADVETTNKEGFAATREKLAEFERETGFVYTTDQRQRRELNEVGLLALVAYNHGVDHAQEKRYPQALAAYFRAMSLDRQCASAVKAALGSLGGWSLDLGKEGKFADACRVLAVGAELAPGDARIRNNRVAVWRMWAEAESQAGRKDEALAVLNRAAAELVDEDFTGARVWVFAEQAEERAKAGDWEGALKAAEPGFQKLNGRALEDLVRWRTSLLGRWVNAHLEAGEYEKAAEAIDRGVKLVPDEKRFSNSLGYLAQEWSRRALRDGQMQEGEQALKRLLVRYPQVSEVKDAAQSYFFRQVDELTRTGKYQEALEAAERSRGVLGDAEAIRRLQVHAYDRWARELRQQKKWQESVDVYVQALEKHPKDKTLVNNEQATWFTWADSYMREKNYAKAIEIYQKALVRYPGQSTFEQNIKYCKQEMGEK